VFSKKFLPEVDASDLRVNRNGKTNLSISLGLQDLDQLNHSPTNGLVVRSDFNYGADEVFFLMSLETHSDAIDFKKISI